MAPATATAILFRGPTGTPRHPPPHFRLPALNPRDFGPLALPHMDALYRTARRLTARAAEAEDLVQQTYLEGYRSFRGLRDPARCRAWLFRIMRNVLFHLRQRRQAGDAGGTTVDGAAGPVGNLEQEVLDAGYSDEIELALRGMPEEFRTAFLLVAVEELSYEEVAEAMECPIGTVRSRVARARALLMAELSATRAPATTSAATRRGPCP